MTVPQTQEMIRVFEGTHHMMEKEWFNKRKIDGRLNFSKFRFCTIKSGNTLTVYFAKPRPKFEEVLTSDLIMTMFTDKRARVICDGVEQEAKLKDLTFVVDSRNRRNFYRWRLELFPSNPA